jgi:hypothetical protein
MLSILAIISLLSLGFVADSNAAGYMFEWGLMTSETIELLGTPVTNPAGEMLGTINAFVNDSEGHAAFVILWQDMLEDFKAARYVAVPFSALSISRTEPLQMTVVLNMDKAILDSAPSFDRINDLNNTEMATRVYRYFGQVPYWTEGGTENPGSATSSQEGGYDSPY